MHLYTLVAAPFVAQLLGGLPTTDPSVGRYGSIIQGAFLLGWALGGEKFPLWSLLGAGVVLIGVWLIFRRTKDQTLAQAAVVLPDRG